jgi:hypothetical protein
VRTPRATAPRIPPSYGVPTDGSGGDRLPWSWAVERLTEARTWSVWQDDAVWFGTSPAR